MTIGLCTPFLYLYVNKCDVTCDMTLHDPITPYVT